MTRTRESRPAGNGTAPPSSNTDTQNVAPAPDVSGRRGGLRHGNRTAILSAGAPAGVELRPGQPVHEVYAAGVSHGWDSGFRAGYGRALDELATEQRDLHAYVSRIAGRPSHAELAFRRDTAATSVPTYSPAQIAQRAVDGWPAGSLGPASEARRTPPGAHAPRPRRSAEGVTPS